MVGNSAGHDENWFQAIFSLHRAEKGLEPGLPNITTRGEIDDGEKKGLSC